MVTAGTPALLLIVEGANYQKPRLETNFITNTVGKF